MKKVPRVPAKVATPPTEYRCHKCGASFPGPQSLEWHRKVCGGLLGEVKS